MLIEYLTIFIIKNSYNCIGRVWPLIELLLLYELPEIWMWLYSDKDEISL